MCREAVIKVLYRERQTGDDWNFDATQPLDEVKVVLYKWFVAGDRVSDVVLSAKVRVGGELVTDEKLILNGRDRDNAVYQRMAMARFDELMANHPTLGQDVTQFLSLLSVEKRQVHEQRLPQ